MLCHITNLLMLLYHVDIRLKLNFKYITKLNYIIKNYFKKYKISSKYKIGCNYPLIVDPSSSRLGPSWVKQLDSNQQLSLDLFTPRISRPKISIVER